VNDLDRNKDRVFEHDALGRLIKAKGGAATGITGVTADWTQEYSYDRYGNKTGTTKTGVDKYSSAIPLDGLPSVGYDAGSNRMNATGWEYDSAGNLLQGQNVDGVWQRFEYDAAGRW
jgi:YD repeat-containing protein